MSRSIRDRESTVLRMAGNIAAGLCADPNVTDFDDILDWVPVRSVELARAIVAEVERTAPAVEETPDAS
jgi:hypothetical protein